MNKRIVATIALMMVTLMILVLRNKQLAEELVPSVAYIAPAIGGVQNIYLAPLDKPSSKRQITDEPLGVFDFAVSPHGTQIAYAARDPETRLNDLYLMDLRTLSVEQMTNCIPLLADCRSPVFHPDGTAVAYEQYTLVDKEERVRIFLIDVAERPFDAHPLHVDETFQGYSPRFARDGETMIFYSPNESSIMVYGFAAEGASERKLSAVSSTYGTVGTISEDGTRLIYPQIAQSSEQTVSSYLSLIDFSQPEPEPIALSDSLGKSDDVTARWHPDGQHVTIARRYTDERYTRGYQLYQMDSLTGTATPLLVDARYDHGYFEWDKTGDELLVQRLPLFSDSGDRLQEALPEIWILAAGSSRLIADNAFHPRWVNCCV